MYFALQVNNGQYIEHIAHIDRTGKNGYHVCGGATNGTEDNIYPGREKATAEATIGPMAKGKHDQHKRAPAACR